MNKLIAFTGPIGSGKTTAAKELYALGFMLIRFAGPLKAMLCCLGLTKAHTDGDLKEVPCDLLGGATPRYAMQTLGTEWGRQMIGQNLWTDTWKRSVERNIKYCSIVVDDLRFPNELEAVKSFGGKVIMIERGIETNQEHISEQHTLSPDMIIFNTLSLESFKAAIRGLK